LTVTKPQNATLIDSISEGYRVINRRPWLLLLPLLLNIYLWFGPQLSFGPLFNNIHGVLKSIQPSLIDPQSVSFDKKAPADVAVRLLRDGSEFTGVSAGGTALRAGTDYTLSGSTVTLKSAYLATLTLGAAQLDFAFRGDYLDDVHATKNNGDSVSYTFTGTGVDWITATAPDQGTVDVYIDGVLAKHVDTHGPVRATQQKVFGVAGLKNKQHTVTAVKVSGDVMRTDVIRYTTR